MISFANNHNKKFPMRDLVTSLKLVKRLRLLDFKNAVKLTFLGLLLFLTEAAGLSLIYPIIEYIESGRDLDVLMETSAFWNHLTAFYSALGIKISIDILFVTIMIATILRATIGFLNQKLQINVQLGITGKLRSQYYRGILLSNKSYLDKSNTGKILEVYNNLSRAGGGLVTCLLRIQHLVIALLVYLALVLTAEPIVTLFMIFFGIIISFLTSRYRFSMETVTSQLVAQNEIISQRVGMTLRVWRSLKSSIARKQSLSLIDKLQLRWVELTFDVLIKAAQAQRVLVPISAALILAVLYLATLYLDLSITFITFFAVTFLRVQPLMIALVAARQLLAQNVVKVEAYEKHFLNALDEQEIDCGKDEFFGVSLGIKFENVSYRHPKTEKHIFKDFSINVPKGKTVGIFGPSGAGKTTFLDLLARFNLPESGNIIIDEKNITTLNLDSFRDDIFYLDQASTLLGYTVTESISFGNEDVGEEDINSALLKAHCSEFVNKLENGALTFLGEHGAKLSGGQKQRLMLSRLFVSTARIILLDEPTNGLDKETELQVLKEIKAHQKALGATMFVVSHNPLPKDFIDIVINV